MLHILGLILKIIGILLLVIISILLILILSVLFVPVRYQLEACKDDALKGKVSVTWLLHLIQCMVQFDSATENKLHIQVKVGFFSLYDNLRESKTRIKKVKKKKTKTEHKKMSVPEESEIEHTISDSDSIKRTKNAMDSTVEYSNLKESVPDVHMFNETNEVKDKKSLWDIFFGKIQLIINKVLSIPSLIYEKIHLIQEKILYIAEKKEKITAIYQDEQNNIWIRRTWRNFCHIIAKIIPHIQMLKLHFGLGDPAMTGKVLGGLSILYPRLENRLVLIPEFEDNVLEGYIKMNGHIQLIGLVVFAIRSFLNKKFFRLIKQIKKI